MSAANPQPPIDCAQLVFWRRRLPQPLGFQVQEEEARKIRDQFHDYLNERHMLDGNNEEDNIFFNKTKHVVVFTTYNLGTGKRSKTVLDLEDVVGVTVEFSTIKFSGS